MESPNIENATYRKDFSLTDYLVIFFKWWKLFFALVVIFFILGMVYWKTLPTKPFPYSTTIEVANNDGAMIEDINSVKSKLLNAYIPAALKAQADKAHLNEAQHDVSVDIPQDSKSIIVLKSFGAQKDETTILDLHKQVTGWLLEDHAQKVEDAKRALQQGKFQVMLEQEKLQQQKSTLKRRRSILDAKVALVKKQADQLSNTISALEKDRQTASASIGNQKDISQSLATGLFLIDNTLVQYRAQLQKLEEQSSVDLQNEILAFDAGEADLGRQEQAQDQTLKEIDYKITNFKGTRVVVQPSRFLRDVKKGPFQTVVIFTGVGMFLGLFSIVFIELSMLARQELKEQRNRRSSSLPLMKPFENNETQ